ncbi:acid type B receptor subunit 2 [Seminavis robusta]|uniref:Acid type B receptor subunit 2 n=1 Tax=Seminavis robusta TaxID=568900 RepID=A0A9N8HKR9_9STRA|nr:acid type B receptor subunit 2 [Seminavis robusta]|eukprot:Sro774_g200590.1 acid type B receptor subunit 2 (770) ;mRNA; r:4418-6817
MLPLSPSNSRFRHLQRALFLLTPLVGAATGFGIPPDATFPESMTIRASVVTDTVPAAYYDANYTSSSQEEDALFPHYRGFQPDLMRELVRIAGNLDSVTLTFELEQAPAGSYNQQFAYLANDCGVATRKSQNLVEDEDAIRIPSQEDCNRLDMVIADFYTTPQRSMRAQFTPPILKSTASTVHYIHRTQRAISTLSEAQTLQQPVCVIQGARYEKDGVPMDQFPYLQYLKCASYEECIDWLKQEKCALFLEDELELRHTTTQDATLEVNPENFNKQLISWPMNARLDPLHQQLIIRWIYEAHQEGIVDTLYHKYFSVETCPLGHAGVNCNQPCSATHGMADRDGNCVCESTRWTGDDCSEEVQEDKNLIPTGLRATCYAMATINFLLIASSACWLYQHRRAAQIKVAQPLFLSLVLLGCMISTSTIFTFVQEDDSSAGVENVPFCMLTPWLYSVGFSITFGSLFAKIRRVYYLFRAAATMTRATVTAKETILVVGGILLIDVSILTVWTVMDPWEWHREPVTVDQYGYTLSSEGFCRDIPTQFSEGKFVALAVISNLQIFLICVPIVVLIDGSDSKTGVFVRCVAVFLNDFAVIALVIGNLVYSLHFDRRRRERGPSGKSLIRRAMKSFTRRRNERMTLTARALTGLNLTGLNTGDSGSLTSGAIVPSPAGRDVPQQDDNTADPDPPPPPRVSKGSKSVRFDDDPPSPPPTPPASTSTEFTEPRETLHRNYNADYGIPEPIPPRPRPPAFLLTVLEAGDPHKRMSWIEE